MNWKVIERCQASESEEPFEREIAQFYTHSLAEDFINMVLPEERKERFHIEPI